MKSPLELLRSMTRIRSVEEEIARRYSEQKMRCPVHLSIGQESVAVGISAALNRSDWAFSGHRNHAHYLAKGGNLNSMIAEIYGKETGCCGGRGGSMHLSDLECGFIGATPIVASTVPIAAGAALSAKNEGKSRIVVIYLGDGAMEAGVVSETMNFAAVKKLPILFVCENNLYSVYSPLTVQQPENRSLCSFAKSHSIKSIELKSDDVEEIYKAAKIAVNEVRSSQEPYFLEIPTYRWREHCGPNFDNDIGYRTEEEYKEWKGRDPIRKLKAQHGINLAVEENDKIKKEIQTAFENAENANYPRSETRADGVYPKPVTNNTTIAPRRADRRISYAEALREAQQLGLKKFSGAYLMGLGVPDPKGIFGSTLGLAEEFGSSRVFDIPLSEHAVTGIAIGSALTGMRPILTHQRVDFALVSIDQIVNQAAKWHYMFNKSMRVPLVIRMIIGRGWGQGPQHSQSLHAWFAHIPGLKVIMPSTAYDAKGLFLSALYDDSPVILMEHRWLYHIKDEVPEEEYLVPLDKAKVLKTGSDITLIGLSYTVLECMKASKILSKLKIDCEVIDLVSARPIDTNTITNSVKTTGRLIIVDHADPTCGIASEISAIATETCFSQLKSTPSRISLPNHPVPTSPSLSKGYYPTSTDIVRRACKMMNVQVKEELLELNNELNWGDQPSKSFEGPF